MEELTRPPEPPPEADPDSASAPSVTPIPGVVSSKAIGQAAGWGGDPHSEKAILGNGAEAAGLGAGSDQSGRPHGDGRQASPILRAAARLSPIALFICERTVSLLEKINGPLGALGETPRRVIGWVAVATFATSLIVLLISLF